MKGRKSQILDLERQIKLEKSLGKDTKEMEGWLKNWKKEFRKHPEEG